MKYEFSPGYKYEADIELNWRGRENAVMELTCSCGWIINLGGSYVGLGEVNEAWEAHLNNTHKDTDET